VQLGGKFCFGQVFVENAISRFGLFHSLSPIGKRPRSAIGAHTSPFLLLFVFEIYFENIKTARGVFVSVKCAPSWLTRLLWLILGCGYCLLLTLAATGLPARTVRISR
jgi:hypothetical protein